MSFIQFESGREKDRAREELRAARNELLKLAEERSKFRDERKVQKMLRGDDQWMLPSVSEKLDANERSLKESVKKSKKTKKKKKKKRSSDSSSEEEKPKKKKKKQKKRQSSSDSSSSSSAEEEIRKKKRKKRYSSSESSSESSQGEDEWIEKKSSAAPPEKRVERDDWMSGMLLPTFSNKDKEAKKVEPKMASYDPKTSARELNPFWKDGGNGIPTFQKPKSDDDDDDDDHRRRPSSYQRSRDTSHRKGWRKRSTSGDRSRRRSNSPDRHRDESRRQERPRKRSRSGDRARKNSGDRSRRSRSRSQTPPDRHANRKMNRRSLERNARKERSASPREAIDEQNETKSNRTDFLTDQQMNELGAKLLKAEIMGNDELASELKGKLEKAREYRTAHKSEILLKAKLAKASDSSKSEECIMLTKTNSQGVSKPLSRQTDDSDKWGGRAGRKKNKKVETHVGGERVRYFADDDKYDIKQMFENEKFTSAADQDEQFANIAGKSKNPNDDLEDIFADKVRKDLSQSEIDDREKSKAIRQHEELKRTLDSCDKCFDSPKMEKQLIVSMGDQVYLSLPWHEALQTGHCMIVPMQHVSCATQLDEDVWNEVQDYRKAITRMFQSRKQDVIFFETVRYLHKKPHMVIHCVPNRDFELAPFYFKKAIQESEREWSTNKQLIHLKEKDIRRSIPKGLPYFWVHFGMDQGLAHVIEEQDRFPSNFAQETIGGLLNLDARLWRRPRKEPNPIPKVKQFADWWKPFDFNRK